MTFTKQFFGGIFVGLAFGILIGAAIVEHQKVAEYTKMAGVGVILVIIGGAIARQAAKKE